MNDMHAEKASFDHNSNHHHEGAQNSNLAQYKTGIVTTEVVPVVPEDVPMERNFGKLAALGLAFTLLNSWTGLARKLSLVLPSGGSISMIWGLLTSAIGSMLICVSLAEICQHYPLTGGQYDWTFILAPKGIRNGLSFFVAWSATGGWIALTATAAALGSIFITNIISLFHDSYVSHAWHQFLIYLAIVFQAIVLNIWAVRALPHIDKFAGLWSMCGIVTVIIVCLACARGRYQPAKEVFASWTNETGWPDGMAFIMGLLQSVFGLTAFDAATHMIEEMPNPGKNCPSVMISAVAMGSVTSFFFMIVLLFCLSSFTDVLESGATTGPLLTIYYQATRSKVGATCLLMFNFMAFVFVQQVLITISSRMLLSISRDRAMGHMSRWLAPVHPKLKVPVNSIIFCSAWVVVFGLINLGSTVANSAILGSSVVLLQISYFVPILLVFIRGKNAYAGSHQVGWSLGAMRRPINLVALIFLFVTSVCFVFPPFIPVTSGSTMNYVVVVMAIVYVLCAITWFVDGRKNFLGPSELEERLAISHSS